MEDENMNQQDTGTVNSIVNSSSKGVGRTSNSGTSKLSSSSVSDRMGSGTNSNYNDDIGDQTDNSENSGSDMSIKGNGLFGGFKKLSLKFKLIIISVVSNFVMFLLFIVVIFAALASIGIIDIDSSGGSSSSSSSGSASGLQGSSISSNSEFWLPFGSSNVTTSGNVTFASGNPDKPTITSSFGPRTHPITGVVNSMHTGVDLADGKPAGTTNVIASRNGRVVYPSSSDRIDCPTSNSLDGCGGGYGNYIIIEHDDGSSTLYAHLHHNTIVVFAGDFVSQGQVIGKIGSSGNSTGAHLHFEVRINGSTVDPLNYISIDEPRS